MGKCCSFYPTVWLEIHCRRVLPRYQLGVADNAPAPRGLGGYREFGQLNLERLIEIQEDVEDLGGS